MATNFLQQKNKDTILSVKIIPNSSQEMVLGYTEDYLKVKICAPPVENKANKQLIAFLSKTFSVPKSKLSFISGEKSKIKRILFSSVSSEELCEKILVYDRINS